ncbi:MAG: HDOD domain-containing protein [Thermodesulfovibrionales bacterium]|nr:HDOD domain-containing protein [Thermodesulfovibrionales bacterium]
MQKEQIQRAETLVKSIGIPPQPTIVLQLLKKVNKENLDIQEIVDLVTQDASMTAKTLKIANSPFFRKTKVDTIHQAISILGIKNFYAIILTASLEEALKVDRVVLKKFWTHSKLTALTTSLLAQRMGVNHEVAYLTGLFHDVGIALMINKHPDYQGIQDYALYLIDVSEITDKYDTISGYESSLYNTNHCVLAYAMARSWGLDDIVCQVILNHHIKNHISQNPIEQQLFLLLQMSETIVYRYEKEIYNKSHKTIIEPTCKVIDKSDIERIYEILKATRDEHNI